MARDPFRNFNQYKIDPLSEVRNAGLVTNGDVYWVSSVADSAHTTRRNDMGRDVVKETVNQAITAVTDGNNDYVFIIPTDNGTVIPLGTAIDITKDRVHVLGIGNNKPAPFGYGGLTFRGYVAATAVDTELMTVNGAGVELGGFKLLGTSGTAAAGTITSHLLIGTTANGTPHDLWVHDVHVESTQAASANGTTDLVTISGDVAGGIQGIRFDRCWIGNALFSSTNGVVNMGGTAGPTRVEFHDTTFLIDSQATTEKFVSVGTGKTEYTLFDKCMFVNVETGGSNPASAIVGAVLADSIVMLLDCKYVNVTQAGTDPLAFKAPVASGTSTAVRDYGIGVGTAALVPV